MPKGMITGRIMHMDAKCSRPGKGRYLRQCLIERKSIRRGCDGYICHMKIANVSFKYFTQHDDAFDTTYGTYYAHLRRSHDSQISTPVVSPNREQTFSPIHPRSIVLDFISFFPFALNSTQTITTWSSLPRIRRKPPGSTGGSRSWFLQG